MPAQGFDPTAFRPVNILLELVARLAVSAFFRIQKGPSPVASTLEDLTVVARQSVLNLIKTFPEPVHPEKVSAHGLANKLLQRSPDKGLTL